MSESPQENQVMRDISLKKWCEVSCKECNKLLLFHHFTCHNCKFNFCLECYQGVISIFKTNSCCNLNATQLIENQESIEEYQSALITCEFSDRGCETILPYKEIYIHKLNCPFRFIKCKNENLIAESNSQILNNFLHKKRNCPENQSTIFKNEIEVHSKLNCLFNLVSCIFCKMMIPNEIRKEHIQFCKMNLKNKRFKLSRLDMRKDSPDECFKNIIDSDLLNVNENIIIRNMNDDLNSKTKKNFNNLTKRFERFNFSKFKNSNFIKFKNYKTLKLVSKIKGKQELTNNYYLFYFENIGKNLHVINIKTSDVFFIELYFSWKVVDASFHQNSIFLCGGKSSEDYLNTCAIIDIKSRTIDKTKELNEKKSGVSLISTEIILFCLGGNNGNYLNTCEYFDQEKLHWIKINPLNNPDCCITSSFDSQKYIYTFGGEESNSYERIDSTILTGKWELLNLSGASERVYGNSFLLNNAQFLVFGGEYTTNKNFCLFNVSYQKLEKLNKKFKESGFSSSKPIYFEGSIWIDDQYSGKRIFEVNVISLDCEEHDIEF